MGLWMWSGASVARSTPVQEDLDSIPTQDGIFLETLISHLYDHRLQSLFLSLYCNLYYSVSVESINLFI